jgi:hypothetical protein
LIKRVKRIIEVRFHRRKQFSSDLIWRSWRLVGGN